MENNKIHVSSETGRLRRLLIHSPDGGIGKIIPSKFEDWLYDDTVNLKKMRKEYDAYAYRTKIVSYKILEEKCIGCTKCVRACPVGCITGKVKELHIIDENECIACGACYDACRFGAIEKP
jgi:Na+-translocating ferredoxin:NAD+ oxidoreductase RNF subunit RnfB